MHAICSLEWTDRETVCARLAEFLEAPVLTDDFDYCDPEVRLRHSAVMLLSHLSGAESIPLFTRLLLDEEQPESTRHTALEALRRRGVRLPASCLDQLGPRHGWLWSGQGWPDELCDYLSLVDGSADAPQVWAFFGRITPHDRALFLLRFLSRPVPANAVFRERLYQRWLQEDRECLDEGRWLDEKVQNRWVHVNARILSFTRDRPESATVLEVYRRRPAEECNALWPGVPGPSDGWESLPAELWSGVAELLEAVRAAPEAYAARAERLDLPYEAMLEYLTPETLQARIEAEIRAASARHASSSRPRHECMTTATNRALELLQKCPDDTLDGTLQDLKRCPDLHDYVWWDLYAIYWERLRRFAPEACRRAAHRWTAENSDQEDRGRALLQLAADRRPEDREFFWRCLDEPEKAEFRFRGLLALEALGEDTPEWRARLTELAEDPDPLTAMEARTALYRRGDLTQLDAIAALVAAEGPVLPTFITADGYDEASFLNYDEHNPPSSEPFVRAMWVRRLGELNALRFRALFEAVVQDPVPPDWGLPVPDRMEAAYHLSRLDDDAARTALLRACLRGPVWIFEWVAEHALPPGSNPPPPNPIDTLSDDWRQWLPWEWLCC